MSSQSEGLFRNDDPDYEPQEGTAARLFRWFVYGFVGILVAGVAVWVLSGSPDKPVPTIKGSATPDRMDAPQDAARVPHQDQPIYERLAAGSAPDRGQELLPGAEQPMTRAQLAAVVDGQSSSGTNQTPTTSPPAATPSSEARAGDTKVDAADSAPETPAPTPRADTETAAVPPSASHAPPSVTKDASPAEPAFRIQVASVGNADQAAAEWARISSRHPDLLSWLKGFYPEFTSSSGNTFTRVQGGPLVDKALAELLCSQLKARKVDCFVVDP